MNAGLTVDGLGGTGALALAFEKTSRGSLGGALPFLGGTGSDILLVIEGYGFTRCSVVFTQYELTRA